MEKLIINTKREAYSIEDVRRTITVKELIDYLDEYYEDDTPIYLSFDNGYTYGGLDEEKIEEIFSEDD